MVASGFDPLEVEKALKTINPKEITKGKKQVKKTIPKKEKKIVNAKEKLVKKKIVKPTVVKKQVKPKEIVTEEKLEKEIKEFHTKPKEVREKKSQEFDFSKITSQIKEKVKEQKLSGGEIPNFDNPNLDNSEVLSGEIKQERIPTGIPGLDELIEGGFEKGSTILTVGSAGSGKTLFCLQFLYNGAKENKEPGIFISFEEGRESLYRHSKAFGWDFEDLEKKGLFKVLKYKPHQVEKLMQDGGGPIRDAIRQMGAKRLVIDSITSYSLLFKDEYQKRENILGLFDLLRKWGTTSVIISELPPRVAEVKEGSVGFLTDAIISLYYMKGEEKGVRVHSAEILKMRGTRHSNKLLALGFEKDGLVIYPEVEIF